MSKKEQHSAENAEKTQTEPQTAGSAACSENKKNDAAAEEKSGQQETAGTESSGADASSAEDKFSALEKEHAELKDQYLRKCADFDNYRKRMIREKQETFDYANTNLLTDLVSVLDDFDRALAAGDDAKNQNADPAAIIDGIKMMHKQLFGLLESKYNLTSYGAKGDPFDHDRHEAIASVPSPVAEPVCAEVYLKGYMLKDRVIRPAKVMVHMPDGSAAVGDSGTPEEKNAEEKPADK